MYISFISDYVFPTLCLLYNTVSLLYNLIMLIEDLSKDECFEYEKFLLTCTM